MATFGLRTTGILHSCTKLPRAVSRRCPKRLFRPRARSLATLRETAESEYFPYKLSSSMHKTIYKRFLAVKKSNGDTDIYADPGEETGSSAAFPSKPSKDAIKLSKMWLRDHCQCDKCIHPDTQQRTLDISNMPTHEIRNVRVKKGEVTVTWLDGHESRYRTEWIAKALDKFKNVADRQGYILPTWWTVGTHNSPPSISFQEVISYEEGVAEWTKKIQQFGFCFVDDCPVTPEATQKLLELLGPIRHTHYGGFWDFTSNLASKDTAYTTEALDAHTDTTYFTEPAGLQMFHLLSHDGEGGETQLVDGFKAAARLYHEDHDAYIALASTPIISHASGNENISIQPQIAQPVLVHDATLHKLMQVRWNNSDRASFALSNKGQAKQIDEWYRAAKVWSDLLRRQAVDTRMEFKLKPGRPLIFDNWRVLHGRSAFNGKRRMCGGYLNKDDFISRYRTSNFGYKEILSSGVY